MIFDTLQYTDAGGNLQEIALRLSNIAAHGNLTLKINPKSHAPGECVLTWALPPEQPIAIPFRSRCKIYFSRTSDAGAPNTFSAGTIGFQGRRWDNEGSASKSKVLTTLTLLDAWKDLEKIGFQIIWQYESGGTIAAPTFSNFPWPDIVLFQPVPNQVYAPLPINNTITTWQQIQDIIAFAIAFIAGADAVQLQLGALGFAPVYCNWYPVRSQSCGDCLKFCLRPHPAVYTEIDYTTTPPTLHFRNRGSMTAITSPYIGQGPDGTRQIATEIQSLDELVPDAVRLYYRINGTFNGQSVGSFGTDIWPLNSPNSLLCLDYSIDITGASTTQTIKNFTSNNFNPTDLSLWRTKVPALRQIVQGGQIPNDGNAGALQFVSASAYDATTNPKGIQVIDDNGNPIDFIDTFEYWTDQSVYAWFDVGDVPAQAVKATVKAFFTYEKKTAIGSSPTTTVTDSLHEHEHHFRIVLTNAFTAKYQLDQTTAVGELIPANLAQSLWTELQPLQWKLRHEIIQAAADSITVPTLIKPGKHMLNLSGGQAAWTTMNAVPENVSIQFYRTADGRLVAHHQIQTGPVNHLEPGYLIQLANLFWNRNRSGVNANQRLSGTTSSSQVDLSGTDSKENSTSANAVPTIQNIVSTNTGGNVNGQIIHDASAIADILDNADDPEDPSVPTPIAGQTAASIQTMVPTEVQVCDNSGNPYYIIIMATGGYTRVG